MTGDKKYEPINLSWWIIVALVIVLVLLFSPTWAQHECRYNCPDDNPIDVSQVVTGPIIGGNDYLGFGGPQFDVDIGQCMGTKSDHYIFGLWSNQRMVENYWCHAITLINAGYVDAGIFMLCKHTVLSEMDGCPGPFVELLTRPETTSERDDQQEMLSNHDSLQMTLMNLQTQFDDLAKTRPQIVYRVPPEVKEQIDDGAVRRAAARAALEKKEQ